MAALLRQLAIVSFVFCVALTPAAFADDRPADAILAEIVKAVGPPFDPARQEDEAWLREWSEQHLKAVQTRAALILELHQKHPDHPALIQLLPERWQNMMGRAVPDDTLEAEVDAVLQRQPQGALAMEARYMKALVALRIFLLNEPRQLDKALEVVQTFIDAAPDDERGAELLSYMANGYPTGSDEQIATLKRIKAEFPTSDYAKQVDGRIRQATSIGKPFEMAFDDAITGKRVDMKDLRRKVVVIDFWATSCGPCAREMPHLKELYEKYHERGLEIIGVSLDDPEEHGGLTRLKKFVAAKQIPWPQYYQGSGWEGEFSSSWGIYGIPTMFAVDKKGNLRSVEARGKLVELIPQLLEE